MPIGGNIVAHARAVLDVELDPLRRGMREGSEVVRHGTQGIERNLNQMSASELRVRHATNQLTAAQRKYGENAARTIPQIARLREAEEKLAREQAHSQRRVAGGLFGGRRVRDTERDASRFGRGVLAGSGALGRLGRAASFASTGFLGGAGLAYALTSTIGKAADFQQRMQVLQQVTRATGVDMQRAGRLARRLGADVSLPATSAKDAAVAMVELAKGGLTLRQSMSAARGTLQLAAAGEIEVGEAARIQANALNQFRLGADQASHVADVLAGTAQAASGEIGDMALSLQYTGPIARAMGVSIDETAGAIGLLAKNGILGERSGTALRAVMAGLAHPSRQAADGLKTLGIHAFDSNHRFVGLRSVTEQLHRAQGRMSQQAFQSAAAIAFGREPLAAINALASEGGVKLDRMAAAAGRQGNAARAAAARNRGFKGAMDGLRSAIETTQITIGTQLLPVLSRYLRSAASWLGSARNQQRIQRGVNQAMRTAGQVLQGVAGAYRTLRGPISTVVHALGGVRNTTYAVIGAFAAWKIAGAVGALLNLRRALFGVAAAERAVEAASGGGVLAPGGRVGRAGRLGRVGRAGRLWAAGRGGLLGGAAGLGTATVAAGAFTTAAVVASAGSGRQVDTSHDPRRERIEQLMGDGKIPRAVVFAAMRAAGLDDDTALGDAINDPTFFSHVWGWASRHGLVGNRPAAARGEGLRTDAADRRGPSTARPPAAAPRAAAAARRPRGPFADVRVDDSGNLVVPFAIRLALAQHPDSIRTLDQQRDFLRHAIASHKLHGDALISAYSELHSVQEQIDADAEKKREAAARRREQAQRRAATARRREQTQRRRERATERRQARTLERRRGQAVTGRLLRFQTQLTRAEATPRTNDDLAVLDAEAKYLRSEVRNKTLALGFRQRLQRQLNQINRRINTVRRGARSAVDPEAAAKLVRQMFSAQQSFQQSFAPNLFTEQRRGSSVHRDYGSGRPQVTVVQNFQSPTTDRHREARLAYAAARAQFDS